MTTDGRVFPRTYGAKYLDSKDWTVAQVAAAIVKDFKAAQAAGTIPADLRLARRTPRSRRALLPSIVLTVTATTPRTWQVEWDEHGETYTGPSKAARDLTARIQALAFAYNYRGSDPDADWVDVRFTTTIRLGDTA